MAQKGGPPAPPASQIPRIAVINFYGLRKIPLERVQKVLGVRVGDPLPPSKEGTEESIASLSGMVDARLEAVCCVGNGASLFVGVEERGAPHFSLRSEPTGAALLPASLFDAYQQFLLAVREAASRGVTAEDLTAGHSLMASAKARGFQQQFLAAARDQLPLVRDVLRDSADDDQRAAAAYIIGYAPTKAQVVDDLQFAMQDPDPAVRSNAMRGLAAIGVLAVRKPALGLKISPTWFIEMLNSLVLSDRYQASIALGSLTENRAPGDLEQIRERAMAAVVEMARWQTLEYALPSFILAGRIAGLPEQEIHAAWKRGDRESVIEKALATARQRHARE